MVALVVLLAGMVGTVWAQGHGQGRGRGQSTTEEKVEEVGREAVDAVADELLGKPAPAGSKGMPPGLAKQGKTPPGLAKQGKTPPGWDKGRKQGWQDTPKQESLIRRVVRGIFGKAKEPAQPEAKP